MHWYRTQMPTMQSFKDRYAKEKPFEGMRILVCMHCEPKAAFRTEALMEYKTFQNPLIKKLRN